MPKRRMPVLTDETVHDEAGEAAPGVFDDFVTRVEPKLRLALVALYGPEHGRDATAEALAYAWEHWPRVSGMVNPAGYLFRVGQSRGRRRKEPVLFVVPEHREHSFEPQLPDALRALSEHQRIAVVLIHGYGWQAGEVAELLGVKPTTIANHLSRGLSRLRQILGVDDDAH